MGEFSHHHSELHDCRTLYLHDRESHEQGCEEEACRSSSRRTDRYRTSHRDSRSSPEKISISAISYTRTEILDFFLTAIPCYSLRFFYTLMHGKTEKYHLHQWHRYLLSQDREVSMERDIPNATRMRKYRRSPHRRSEGLEEDRTGYAEYRTLLEQASLVFLGVIYQEETGRGR